MEYWDIYDEKKERTGRTMARNDWHMKPGDYHLTVLALIINETGRILLTQRQLDKQWAPGKWEIPGGGVKAGETSLEAVLRETREETGLVPDKAAVRLIHTYRNDSPKEQNNYFVDIYEVRLPFTESAVTVQKRRSRGLPFLTLKRSGPLAKEGKSSIMPILRIYFRRRPQPCLKMSFYCFFPASFRQCLYRGSHLAALFAGLLIFSGYARYQGFSLKEIVGMWAAGVKTIRNILMTFVIIGFLTGLWRAGGTIPTIVYYASGVIDPALIVLLTFVLNCLLSF